MKNILKNITYPAIFVALITVCAWISVPTAVPFTLQTFAVCTAAGLLGFKRSVSAVAVYIALGAVGVPVFSGFRGGVGALFGATGGYIVGFLFITAAVGAAVKLFGKKPLVLAVSMAAGGLLCYVFGTAWFMIVYSGTHEAPIGLLKVLSMCVLPFIIPDALKISLAVFVTVRVDKAICEKTHVNL